ncbi:suppressor of lurcher protein 1 [Topomyia yanbarensis]|uniref:suppressor of lurcher protein 1 n=1 Tax=Topomyia yanbarensis TaxID=2498891 RepID=UPI00273BE206|nr:suppressor of lurcher protein 1 [Topomyia yanbarensis]XP_058812995.1 suppressor of lurcher protein 1 [Topomyia yanbarensis]XP_058812996.1 suppressor of lurcher protein 1 [Topomyia yanbarensis]XP_058812997.1 suppressor of lurcher protein 1 [Topomyia yanbarensis]XP_058812998.1 suppressor of lurcher protein 1 [Topomyia yanbarensis]XP_058813000.1 suppressor of lurcher protein 1 [Topomyia yanbarensis]
MRHNHQLVKVTNFLFHLTLVLPGVLVERRNTAARADASSGGGGEVVQSGKGELMPPSNSVGVGGIEPRHGKGYYKGSPHCTRLVFSSGRARNGSIAPSHSKHSGLFPSAICYQYEFVGQGLERIQIVFSEFRLPSKLEPNECGETDILMVFSHQDGRDEVIETLCGDILPKPILSNGPRLLLEFRSTFNNTENKGFTADFFFLTNFGIPTGHQPNQSECSFHYFKNATNQGWIQSPNFPGAYPRNIRCNYFFYGDPLDYVLIRFTYFDIEGIAPCDENSASDYVEFSNFITRDRKFALYCGLRRDLIVRSDGRFFRVTMASNDRLDGTGFRALYAFESSISAGMLGGPSGGSGGGGVVGVVGAAGVPYLPQQQQHQQQQQYRVVVAVTPLTTMTTTTATGRNTGHSRRRASGGSGGFSSELRSHGLILVLMMQLLLLLLISSRAEAAIVGTNRQYVAVTYSTHRRHQHHHPHKLKQHC